MGDKKGGRPKGRKYTEKLTLTITPKQKNRLSNYADNEGMTTAQVIRKALTKFLKENYTPQDDEE